MQAPDVLDLPGPRRFMDRVCADIDAGTTVVVAFPQVAIDSGLADRIVDSIGTQAGAGLVERGESHLPTQMIQTLDFISEWRPSHDPWWDLAHWPALGGRALALRSWEHDVAAILQRWEALTHEASRAPAERLRLVIGAGSSDVERALLERTRPLHIAVRWWWGVIDRIDTELHLRRQAQPTDPLEHAERVERLSWDLGQEAAQKLPCEGDAEHASQPVHTTHQMARGHERASGRHREVPPVDLRKAWNCGTVDLWDGRYRPRITANSRKAELDVIRWRAQVQVLFPYLEEHRRKLQHLFLVRAREAGLSTGQDDTWEIGQMFGAVQYQGVKLPLDVYDHLRAAREVRNALAHGRPADEKYLIKLFKVIPL